MSGRKSVNIAELSMSGNLSASIPVQILVKFDPPGLTLIYHFEGREKEQFFHEIPLPEYRLKSETVEAITDYLFMYESYYFNPKTIKRD